MGFKKSENWSDAAIFGTLTAGGTVGTEVYDPEKSKAAGPVYLKAGDHVCSACGEDILPEDYPGADYANLLARLKLQYGHTVCPDCHGALGGGDGQ